MTEAILIVAILFALVGGWYLGNRHGARRALRYIVSALAIYMVDQNDEYVKLVSGVAMTMKTERGAVKAGAKVVGAFLDH